MKPAMPIPRGRHAPPLEIRRQVQRRRLLDAGAELVDLADAYTVGRITCEDVSRHAGMSKATFYEHFGSMREFREELCNDLRIPGTILHVVQHAAVMCNLLLPADVAQQLAASLQRLGWRPPTGSEA